MEAFNELLADVVFAHRGELRKLKYRGKTLTVTLTNGQKMVIRDLPELNDSLLLLASKILKPAHLQRFIEQVRRIPQWKPGDPRPQVPGLPGRPETDPRPQVTVSVSVPNVPVKPSQPNPVIPPRPNPVIPPRPDRPNDNDWDDDRHDHDNDWDDDDDRHDNDWDDDRHDHDDHRHNDHKRPWNWWWPWRPSRPSYHHYYYESENTGGSVLFWIIAAIITIIVVLAIVGALASRS